MSKFTIYILLIIAVFIGGTQEVMRRNAAPSNQIGEVTPKPTLSANPETSPQVAKVNSPIPDSESSKVVVALATEPEAVTTTSAQEPVKQEPGKQEVTKQETAKSNPPSGSIYEHPDQIAADIKSIAKGTNESLEKSKTDNISQPVTTLKTVVDLRDLKNEDVSEDKTVLRTNPFEKLVLEQFASRTNVKKAVTDGPLTHTALQVPAETDKEKAQRESERLYATDRLSVQFLYRQNLMAPADRIKGDFDVKLVDVLKTTDRASRLRNIRAYWNLVTAMIDYHWAFLEEKELKTIDTVITPDDGVEIKLCQAAHDASKARFAEARATLISAQFELQSVAGLKPWPIAVDIPLVEKYNTILSYYYPNLNQAPPRLMAINEMLSVRLATINSRVWAERGASDTFMMARSLYERKQLGAQYVVIAYEQLAKHRRALLASVRDYNFEIAEYVIAVAGDRSAITVANALTHRDPNEKRTSIEDGSPMLAPEQQFNVDSKVQQASTFKYGDDGNEWGPRPNNEMQSVMKRDE